MQKGAVSFTQKTVDIKTIRCKAPVQMRIAEKR